MTSKAERLQRLYHQHQAQHGGEPHSTTAVVRWALEHELLEPPTIDPVAFYAESMARALRDECRTDAATGQRYRVNHATQITMNGVQTSLWGEMESAPREFIKKAFAQRRRQIVSDCVQLQIDVNVYNAHNPSAAPIQLVMDFTEDVAERLAVQQNLTAANT